MDSAWARISVRRRVSDICVSDIGSVGFLQAEHIQQLVPSSAVLTSISALQHLDFGVVWVIDVLIMLFYTLLVVGVRGINFCYIFSDTSQSIHPPYPH